MGDEQAARARARPQVGSRFRIWAWTDTSSAETASSSTSSSGLDGQRAGDRRPAGAGRPRAGAAARSASRWPQADASRAARSTRARRASRSRPRWNASGLGDRRADGAGAGRASERVLEDDLGAAAAAGAAPGRPQSAAIGSPSSSTSPPSAASSRSDAFAPRVDLPRAGLAHQGQRLAPARDRRAFTSSAAAHPSPAAAPLRACETPRTRAARRLDALRSARPRASGRAGCTQAPGSAGSQPRRLDAAAVDARSGSAGGTGSRSGRWPGARQLAGDRRSSSSRRSRSRGRERSRPQRVRVTRLRRRARPHRPVSTTRPAYITTTRSHIAATTPRSWVMKSSARPRSAPQLGQQATISAWVVTSSAVVGSSATSSCGSRGQGRRRSSPAAASRPRARAGTARRHLLGLGEADRREQLDRRAARSPRRACRCATSAPRSGGRRRAAAG